MSLEKPNHDFLKNKYNLHTAPEVEAAVRRTKARGEEVKNNPHERIENYLDRFKEIIERKDIKHREQGIQAMKQVLLDRFVTKFEDIPESWHSFNEKILRERGQGGDWDRMDSEEKDTARRHNAQAVLADQEASLEQWIDYLITEEMPEDLKYWTFRSITDLAEYDKVKKEFPKRSKGTVKMFPDVNHEALAYVIDAIKKNRKGEKFTFERFEFELGDEIKDDFLSYLSSENFAKLYSWANEQIHPIPQHLLPVTEGKWVQYFQDEYDSENYKELSQSIRGRGTGWCTAGENTAKEQLSVGDFFVYYTNDDNGNAVIPRIAIRRENESIAEVRGVAYKQNLDPYIGEELEKKLNEFPDKAQYLKKEQNMKLLTMIDNKVKNQQQLSTEDLAFIYEINYPIIGFGQEADPRIREIRSGRNIAEDMPVAFDCMPEQIAHSVDEINADTKAFVGALGIDVFKKLPWDVDYVYTSFPDKKIRFMDVILKGDKISLLEEEWLKDGMESCLGEITFSSNEQLETEPPLTVKLVQLTVRDLGFPEKGRVDEIYDQAFKLGLELCSIEAALKYRFEDCDLPMKYVHVGMEPGLDDEDYPAAIKIARTYSEEMEKVADSLMPYSCISSITHDPADIFLFMLS